jgi:hypothetical protein
MVLRIIRIRHEIDRHVTFERPDFHGAIPETNAILSCDRDHERTPKTTLGSMSIAPWTPIDRTARCLLLVASALGCVPAHAQQALDLTLPPITILGTTPLLGSGVDRDTVPAASSVLRTEDLTRAGTLPPDVVRTLNETIGGANLDSASGNPFQPTLFFHGFAASALQGTPQGLAVYLNGIRFNQAFGDTVNFDLLPNMAIERLDIEGSNPAFGLNALGGSVSIKLRDGFSFQGGEAEVSGGAFLWGQRSGNTETYVSGGVTHQGGWRDQQSSDLQNLYGDIGWRGSAGELHLNVSTRSIN